jgi:O-antigen/teichoic acid export membrane protein
MATGEQYFRLAIQFASIASVSRLLTPTEIGIAVIGSGIMAIALNLREFATSDYLIQRQEVLHVDVRASFTVLFLVTALIAVGIFALAPWFGGFYSEEKLTQFLGIVAIAGLIEAVSLPIRGLLRREMAFGALAFINTTSAAVTAVTTVLLALAGFSYMSVAWAKVAAAIATTVFSFYFRPDFSILRPTIRSWSRVLTFGRYNGASYVISVICDELPSLVLGRMLPHSAVGVYDRALVTVCIPDRVILTSASSVAFPALATEIRRGGSLKEPYLRALGYITVFYWPALAMLGLLAYPVVSLLLGQQWRGVAPVLQVMAVAYFAWFPVMLTSPVLLALGANRHRALAVLLGRSVTTVVLCASAHFGVMAMAVSMLLTQPYQMIVSLSFVRRHVLFRWREIWVAVWRSAVVTVASAVGPAGVIVLTDSGFHLSITAAALAASLAAAGWVAGVLITRHPVLPELRIAMDEIAGVALVRRFIHLGSRVIADRPGAREAR